MQVVSVALQVLGLLELPEEDVPAELIWHHDELLKEHFEAVNERRRNPGSSEPLERVPMTKNDLAKGVGR